MISFMKRKGLEKMKKFWLGNRDEWISSYFKDTNFLMHLFVNDLESYTGETSNYIVESAIK